MDSSDANKTAEKGKRIWASSNFWTFCYIWVEFSERSLYLISVWTLCTDLLWHSPSSGGMCSCSVMATHAGAESRKIWWIKLSLKLSLNSLSSSNLQALILNLSNQIFLSSSLSSSVSSSIFHAFSTLIICQYPHVDDVYDTGVCDDDRADNHGPDLESHVRGLHHPHQVRNKWSIQS